MVSESVPAPDSLNERLEAMARRLEAVESENRALRTELDRYREQKKKDDATIERLQREKQEVHRRLEKFIRLYFSGKKSEVISAAQMELALQGLAPVMEEASKPAADVPASKPERKVQERRPRRALDDERLQRRQTVIEPEEVTADPKGWTRIGEERTAQLDYEPGYLFRHEIIRPRYVRREEFAIAPLPGQPIDKGMVGAGLLAWLLSGKYADHLPLYRMAGILRRQQGVDIPRNTLAGWVEQAAEQLKPIYRRMLEELRKRTYLQIDETVTRYLDPDVKGSSRIGYFWVYHDPGGEVVFQWDRSRSHEVPMKFLGDYCGTIQVDGYSAYETLAKKRAGQLQLAHCWAHVRREFLDAKAEAPRVAAWVLRQIQLMYSIESELRDGKAGPRLRAARRAAATAMVLERLKAGMIRLRGRQLPEGALAKAIDYALERWEGLSRFVGDGRLEIDNNRVENAIRPCAVGRKNWLFVGAPDAGERSAILFSLIASCRLHGVDPFVYLRDVLTRLPQASTTDWSPYTPKEWAKARRARTTSA